MSRTRLLLTLAVWLAFVTLSPGCGRQAPVFAPPPAQEWGALSVVSTPAGAAILLDGQDTGFVTPDTLEAVVVGPHVVRVALAGYAAQPESLVVEVMAPLVASASFTLAEQQQAPLKVVLLEGFSNVDCLGCPELAATLAAVMAEPGHGLDRLLLVKYATNWPNAADPHYQANPQDNLARLTFYLSDMLGIPTLFADGALVGSSGQAPTQAELSALVDELLAGDPGFGLAVSATLSGTSVAAEVTLTAARPVARDGAVLRLALLENPISYAVPPGSQGETEFHWIMRDLVTLAESPLPLAAGEPRVLAGNLVAQLTWVPGHLAVAAFVQDPATREILQAGYTPVSLTALSSSPLTEQSALVTPSPSNGRSRP